MDTMNLNTQYIISIFQQCPCLYVSHEGVNIFRSGGGIMMHSCGKFCFSLLYHSKQLLNDDH